MTSTPAPRDVVILGSTGSIGTQALDLVRRNPGRFRVRRPGRRRRQPGPAGQAGRRVRRPDGRGGQPGRRPRLSRPPCSQHFPNGPGLAPRTTPAVTVLAGPDAVCELAGIPLRRGPERRDGAAGLRATLAALDAGRTLALANKESLIIGGPLVTSRAKPGQIVPVDSEHSTIAQCLRAGQRLGGQAAGAHRQRRPVPRLAAGRLESVTPEQALAHPTWNMGPLITVNSATLVNKGLEVIEAHLLFGFGLDQIDVVVHPQSIVHSMVEFADGATIIQASPPDMRIPIALGLAWPERVAGAAPGLDWTKAAHLDVRAAG